MLDGENKYKQVNFIWRRAWIHPYESLWSLFEKLLLINQIDWTTLNNIMGFGKNNKVVKLVNIYDFKWLDEAKLEYYTGINIKLHKAEINKLQRINKYQYSREIFNSHLVFCEVCIHNSFHSYLHQLGFVFQCPFHKIILTSRCIKCSHTIPWKLINTYTKRYTCINCGNYYGNQESKPFFNNWSDPTVIQDEIVLDWLK
jgi:hypothetical protein